MSLRARLLVAFVAVILLVVAIMGVFQTRLIEGYFRQLFANQVIGQGPRLQTFVEGFAVRAADTPGARQIATVAAAIGQSRALITDDTGVVVFDTGEGKGLVGDMIPGSLITRTLRTGRIETFDFPSAGPDNLGMSIPWVTNGKITGCLILTWSLQAAARQAGRDAGMIALRAGLLAVGIAAVVAYFLSSTITNPLRRMADAARSISKGNFDEKVPVDSNDELGDLAESMNSMSGEIAGLIDNLTGEKEKLRALMDERTNMLSDISHDLRTPVTSIRGFVEALQDGIIKDETERVRTLSVIHEESERLSRLVDDLFYLARLESGEIPVEMSEVDLRGVVASTVEAIRPLAMKRDAEVTLVMDDEAAARGAKVIGSSDRLTRAVLNVLDNAVKYSPLGKQVKVSLRIEEPDAQAHPRRRAIVSVADQGAGIAQEDLPHLFERFYRADKARSRTKSGTGLGLSIARFIVEQHGGSIWVESVLGQGATFFIAVPMAV